MIDQYYLHRWDKQVPIEDSVGALSDLVRKGNIRSMPRFAPDNYTENLQLPASFTAVAGGTVTTGHRLAAAPGPAHHPHSRQHHRGPFNRSPGRRPDIPQTGTDARLDDLFQPKVVLGSRYNALGNSEVDTEVFLFAP